MSYFIVFAYNRPYTQYVHFYATRNEEKSTIFVDELEEISQTEVDNFHSLSHIHILISKDLILKNAIEITVDGKLRKVIPNTKKSLEKISLRYGYSELKKLGDYEEENLQQSVSSDMSNVVGAYNYDLSRKEAVRANISEVFFQILSFLFTENKKEKTRQITLTTSEFIEKANEYENVLIAGSLSMSESTLKSAIKFLEQTGLLKVEMSKTRPQKYTFTLHPQVFRIAFDSVHSFTEEDIKPQGFKDLFASHEHIGRLYQNHYQ